MVRHRRGARSGLAVLACGAGRPRLGRGRRAQAEAGRPDRVPRVAAVADGGAAQRGAADGQAGRHEHRRDHRPRGRHASGRRRRLGLAGRDRAGHQRGRATGRVQPARPELDAAAVAPGLARLWWIPAGMSPDQGTYVRYDHELTGGVLAAEAARAGAVAIGEDLGTVEPWLRKYLAERRVLGTSMLWFERRADGTPRRPGGWRRGCLAMVGTHDMPPAAAFLTGEQVTLRAELGLLTRPEGEERTAAQAELAGWLAMLVREDLLPRAGAPSAQEFTAALYGFLTRTPAVLIGVSLADAAGERRPQNMPGTVDDYPNWRIPLTGADGQPVLLDDLPAHAGVLAVAQAVSGGLEPGAV